MTQPPWAFQSALQQNLYWFLHPQSKNLDAGGAHVVLQVAKLLAEGYGQLTFSPQKLNIISKRVPDFVESVYFSEDRAFRRPIVELARFGRDRMSPYLRHFFLHGSLASLDYCRGWSDVDTFLVVARETATDPQRLSMLRSLLHEAYAYLTAVDPLQHHGFIVMTEMDLLCFPPSALPPVALDVALSLLPGADAIEFQTRECAATIRSAAESRLALFQSALNSGEFRHHDRDGVYLQARWRNASNAMYQLKYFLSMIMIQPAYLLEALGCPCLKRDSFTRCREILASEWEIIERASAVRRQWPERECHPFRGNAIPSWVRDTIGEDYFERGLGLVAAVAAQVRSSD